ncbi:MAG: hypothetical protein LBM21_02300, partial [Coriobacteriales bacterium]|nr:hypothetical protein [Coriobacteriales bacterium]
MAQQSQDNIKVVVDALGGDDAPSVVLDGVKEVVASNDDISIILTGPEDVISPCASQCDAIRKGSVTAHPTTQFIDMGEHPANAVKAKKDSSIVVGCKLVKSGEADAFFSAGSTGAC